ncbi:MAG: AraC family transcriptional regulator [Spirochaetaceae bacterium]|nr:MAG: AraC family transcriptional regulator [Spirochaetaceae bacterium]
MPLFLCRWRYVANSGNFVLVHDEELWESALLHTGRSIPLHAMITSCGRSRAMTLDYSFDGRRRGARRFAVLQYTLRGEGRLNWEGTEHRLLPGDLMVAAIPHDHRYEFPGGAPWMFVYVCLTGSEAMRAVDAALAGGPVIRLEHSSRLLDLMHETLGFTKAVVAGTYADPGRDDRAFRASALAYSIAMELLAVARIRRAEAHHVETTRSAQRLMRERCDRQIGVADLAAELGLSRSHFTRLFTATAGISPRAFLERVRIERAVDLLYNTCAPIKQIAVECGYVDAGYFTKAFLRCTGETPRTFRRNRM